MLTLAVGSIVEAASFVGPIDFITNYTFRTMVIGTTIIGAASGSLGCFLYLRKQSLISDVIGHSAVLGVMLGFIVASTILGISGRSMIVLTVGSVIAATISVLIANKISKDSPLSIDAAMAICLSLFYGGGTVLMRLIGKSKLPERGGIDKYMFGNAATMIHSDIVTIGIFGGLSILVMLVFWKEFKVFTFDPVLAESLGFSGRVLGPLLLGTATVAVVIGVKAVGLILMIAFAIMPAASARQWTHTLAGMVTLATLIGAGSALGGSYLSVNLGKVPTGPVVVLVLFAVFLFSLLFAPERSVLRRAMVRRAKARQLRVEALGVPAGTVEVSPTSADSFSEALRSDSSDSAASDRESIEGAGYCPVNEAECVTPEEDCPVRQPEAPASEEGDSAGEASEGKDHKEGVSIR